jgi:hypothetical protein
MTGPLLALEQHECNGSWWAWCPGCMRAVAAAITKAVLVRAASLRPLEPPEAHKAVPRRVRGLDGQIRSQ